MTKFLRKRWGQEHLRRPEQKSHQMTSVVACARSGGDNAVLSSAAVPEIRRCSSLAIEERKDAANTHGVKPTTQARTTGPSSQKLRQPRNGRAMSFVEADVSNKVVDKKPRKTVGQCGLSSSALYGPSLPSAGSLDYEPAPNPRVYVVAHTGLPKSQQCVELRDAYNRAREERNKRRFLRSQINGQQGTFAGTCYIDSEMATCFSGRDCVIDIHSHRKKGNGPKPNAAVTFWHKRQVEKGLRAKKPIEYVECKDTSASCSIPGPHYHRFAEEQLEALKICFGESSEGPRLTKVPSRIKIHLSEPKREELDEKHGSITPYKWKPGDGRPAELWVPRAVEEPNVGLPLSGPVIADPPIDVQPRRDECATKAPTTIVPEEVVAGSWMKPAAQHEAPAFDMGATVASLLADVFPAFVPPRINREEKVAPPEEKVQGALVLPVDPINLEAKAPADLECRSREEKVPLKEVEEEKLFTVSKQILYTTLSSKEDLTFGQRFMNVMYSVCPLVANRKVLQTNPGRRNVVPSLMQVEVPHVREDFIKLPWQKKPSKAFRVTKGKGSKHELQGIGYTSCTKITIFVDVYKYLTTMSPETANVLTRPFVTMGAPGEINVLDSAFAAAKKVAMTWKHMAPYWNSSVQIYDDTIRFFCQQQVLRSLQDICTKPPEKGVAFRL